MPGSSPPTLAAIPGDSPSAPDGELTIYLLCAPVPVRHARHYLGITQTQRLAQRLREHAGRRGSSLTAALARVNDHLDLARTWSPATWRDERAMKIRGHYRRLCPICRNKDRTRSLLRIPCPDLVDISREPLAISLSPRPARGERGD